MADLLQDHTKDFMAALARVKEVNDEAVATQTEAANDRVQVDFEIEKLKTRQQALNNTLNAAAKMRTAAQQALHAVHSTADRPSLGAAQIPALVAPRRSASDATRIAAAVRAVGLAIAL